MTSALALLQRAFQVRVWQALLALAAAVAAVAHQRAEADALRQELARQRALPAAAAHPPAQARLRAAAGSSDAVLEAIHKELRQARIEAQQEREARIRAIEEHEARERKALEEYRRTYQPPTFREVPLIPEHMKK